MVYISNDGQIHKSTPWGMTRIVGFFSSIIFTVIMFFKTLFGMDVDKYGSGNSRDYRPGFGPPKPPSRRLGRPSNLNHDINIPYGGCSSCRG